MMRLLLIAVLLCLSITLAYCRLKPPKFKIPDNNRWEPATLIKRRSEIKVIECRAEGNPRPIYEWTRNGELVKTKVDKITFDPDTGDLTLGMTFSDDYNGYYQCIASNSQGKSMTPLYYIVDARADPFKSADGNTDTDVTAKEAKYLEIKCDQMPKSIPENQFLWISIREENNEIVSTPVVEDNRVVIDTKGNLHFLWLVKNDSKTYKCGYHNSVISTTMSSTKTTTLKVESSPNIVARDGDIKFIENDIEVMAGTKAELTCIVSYYNKDPLVIEWRKNNQLLKRTSKDFKYVIEFAKISDQGQYMCSWSIGGAAGTYQGFINLKVTSPPIFLSKATQLKPIFIPKGNDAVFNCETFSHDSYANPPSWLTNGKPIVGCPPLTWECDEKMTNGSLQCLAISVRCDKLADCRHKTTEAIESDERDCPGTKACTEGLVYCNGECIPDGQPCNEKVCQFPDFLCKNKKSCLSEAMVCNASQNCSDLSDEVACKGREDFVVDGYRFNSQRTQMTIPSVDLNQNQCIQCSVTNEYGTAFSDGCLTVIDRITVLKKLNSTYEVSPGMYLNLSVQATTDAMYLSQMNYEWFYHPQKKEGSEKKREATPLDPILLPSNGTVIEISQYFTRSKDNKTLIIRIPDVDETDQASYDAYMALAGNGQRYSIVISHPFDSVESNFTLVGEKIEPPVVVPVVAAASSNLWLIAVILGIIVLIALVVFIVCMVCRRDPRGAYYVDKKEHEAGNDPEQELKDSGFHDVGRVEDDDGDHPETEKISLSESVNQYESDDDITQEYDGDFDISSKFNEDGSFIGVYADKKKNSGSKEVTV